MTEQVETKHTPGPWKAIAQGGSSTVVAPSMPSRNDKRAAIGYGYRDDAFCIAYPFIDDDQRPRMDFVSFSHDDARLIAAAPELLAALKDTTRILDAVRMSAGLGKKQIERVEAAKAAIAKAA